MEQKEDREQKFSCFLDRHRLFIWKLCNRYGDGDLDVGLDHVQEITVLLWLRFDKLRPGAHLRQEQQWISFIARDYFRKVSRHKLPPLEPYDDDMPLPGQQGDAESPSELLDDYLVCLNPADREIIDHYIEGLDAKEIAQQMGTTAEAVRQRLHRAVVRMKEYARKTNTAN